MFFVNRTPYTREQMDALTRVQFALIGLDQKPIKLYKYFPDVVSEESKRNHSQEALENNTIYLQDPLKFDDPYDSTICFDEKEFYIERLKYYADLSGFSYQKEWDYYRFVYEFALYLNPHSQNVESLLSQFKVKGLQDDLLDLTHHNFVLNICNSLLKHRDAKDSWQAAFYSALNSEFAEIQKNLAGHFRIACFTTNPYSMLMWSHYANSHKGFCIEYDFPSYGCEKEKDLAVNLFPVIYSDERVSVLEYCLLDMKSPTVTDEVLWPIYKYGLLTKSLDWMYQNEWRLISCDDLLSNAGKDDYNCTFTPISKVYFGAKMPNERRKQLAEICKEKGIPATCVLPTSNAYAMNECLGKMTNPQCVLRLP